MLYVKAFVASFFSKERSFISFIKYTTGVLPYNLSLYRKALCHSSHFKEREKRLENDNQRLEYLGDAILSAVVADYLYKKFPKKDEGFLTNLRSIVVSRKSLNKVGLSLNLDKAVKKNLDKNKPAHSIYGDAYEALIGAVYLDRGLLPARKFILSSAIYPFWDENTLEKHIISYKSALIEWAQKEKQNYNLKTIKESGEKHKLVFEIALEIDGNELARGKGTSKKRAEENASKKAYKLLNIQ
jgi:ribonuclease-3